MATKKDKFMAMLSQSMTKKPLPIIKKKTKLTKTVKRNPMPIPIMGKASMPKKKGC